MQYGTDEKDPNSQVSLSAVLGLSFLQESPLVAGIKTEHGFDKRERECLLSAPRVTSAGGVVPQSAQKAL